MSQATVCRKNGPGRGATTTKPMAGASSVYLRPGKDASVHGKECEREEVRT